MATLPFKNPQCPACCNKETHVELMVPAPYDVEIDDYFCRCGKCALRFRVTLERRAWLARNGPFVTARRSLDGAATINALRPAA
jgi:hypothetical protein